MNETKEIKDAIYAINSLTKVGIWGKDIEEPFVVFKDVIVDPQDVVVYRKKTATVKIATKDPSIEFIKFRANQELIDDLTLGFGAKRLTIIGTCSVNEWGGRNKHQIEIVDYNISTEQEYIF